MNARAQRKTRRHRKTYSRYWPVLAEMPPLCNWPDRPQPYDSTRSQVLAFIRERCGVELPIAMRIFDSANHKRVIRFDPETRLWTGEDWRP